MADLNDSPLVKRLAVPGVCLLIAFLGYSSQVLFHLADDSLPPGRLSPTESYVFNALLLCLWYTYYKSCTVDPGRYAFPDEVIEVPEPDDDEYGLLRRWCKKCSAPKPPRAHHCRSCGRCVVKMDHHCPWTSNCVSMRTFPHFVRFLLYTNLSLWALARLLFLRFADLWANRALPSYLGPSLPALVHLTLLSLVCFFTSLALFILFFSTLRGWVLNETMIEGWELDRHTALCERSSGRNGHNNDGDFWSVTGPDGRKLRLEKVEFPYDVGIFDNLAQAMGTRNVLMWFFPFAGNPEIGEGGRGVGWEWPENGLNRKEGMWPPPDPDKMRRGLGGWPGAAARGAEGIRVPRYASKEEELEAFKSRQDADRRRWQGERSRLMAELEEEDYDVISDESDGGYERGADGEPGWTNADGERLQDYGVDEDEDMTDDEDVPLAELLRRRKVLSKDGEA
ncbi:dhhc zinc finger membrane protein [Colletotrichum karsti]|uniref:Palmitoyltransferase PFA4 n=1 Tax=Colletotrichum karsti TaxID=1095194 RepID=A0A9P6LMY0_9PEZI|nr:dhhc zinc finger membrane protein [Colletotrichum karsti]KAF9878641.1 dhhc zinc finger membrane protein [Colletotrichum karsti]